MKSLNAERTKNGKIRAKSAIDEAMRMCDRERSVINAHKDGNSDAHDTNSGMNTKTVDERVAYPKTINDTSSATAQKTSNAEGAAPQNDDIIFAKPFYFNSSQFVFEDQIEEKYYPIPKNRPVRIYCDGVYDLFHYGHMRSLMQAKHLFPSVHLLVGVTNDCITLQNKGSLVFNEHERTESVRHCRYVDEVIENAPWSITGTFLETHRIDYVCHDNVPYSCAHSADVYDSLKRSNKFIPTRRTFGISTTNIITKIVKDYDLFVRRQLEKGINADELNLSFFTKESINVKNTIKNIETDLKNEIKEIREELRIALLYWERVSNEMISTFSHRFARTVNEHSLFKKIFRKIILMIERKRR